MIKSQKVYYIIESLVLKFEGKKVPKESSITYKFNRLNNKTLEIARSRCSTLASYINSSVFTIQDLKCYIYYYHLFNDVKNFWWECKFNLEDIKQNEKKFFSKIALKNDKKILLEVNKSTTFDNINDYFITQETGENLACVLLYNKYISPSIYLRFLDQERKLSKANEKQKKLTQVMHVIQGEMQNG
jgi:hypothetical protein